MELQPIGIRLKPDGLYEAIPSPVESEPEPTYTQEEMDRVINKLEEMKADNDKFKVGFLFEAKGRCLRLRPRSF